MKIFNVECGDWDRAFVNAYLTSLKNAISQTLKTNDILICPMRNGIGHVSTDDKSILCIDIRKAWTTMPDEVLISAIREEIELAQRSDTEY